MRLNLSKKIAAAAVAATMVAAGAGSALAFHTDVSASSEAALGTMLDLTSSLELTTALGETLATALDVVGELASTVHGTLDMLSVEDIVATLVEHGLDVALFTADQLAEIVELVLDLVGDLLDGVITTAGELLEAILSVLEDLDLTVGVAVLAPALAAIIVQLEASLDLPTALVGSLLDLLDELLSSGPLGGILDTTGMMDGMLGVL